MSKKNAAPRSVASALEDVAKWRSEATTKTKAELAEVDQEVVNLTTAITNLQQQIEALRRSRDDIARRDERLGDEEVGKSYTAVFSALGEQADALAQRASALSASESARAGRLAEALKNPETAALMTEYAQFKTTVEPTLVALPESYRSVILQHHDGVAKKLRTALDQLGGTDVTFDGPSLEVDAVFAVDAPDGTPEVLMMILPVQETVWTEWSTRADDAQTWVAARVIQGLYSALQGAGLNSGRAAFGGHQGLLAVEVEIGGAKADIGAKIGEELSKALAAAGELSAAKISVRATSMVVDHLLPPEEEG